MSENRKNTFPGKILQLPYHCRTQTGNGGGTVNRGAGQAAGAPQHSDDFVVPLFARNEDDGERRGDWMAAEMRRALREERFVLHYQPQYEMRSGRIVGVEALLRMTLEDGSLVQPDEFIPVAEQNGFIVPLGHWVLREACRQLAEWRALGIGPLRMAVNVSPRQLSDRHLIDAIDEAVDSFGIAYGDLELEITEQCVFDYLPLARNILEELHDRGLRIAVDDFGTGHSSFTYLAELPVDVFKMDRSFLTRVTTHERTRKVVSAMIAMARELDLEIVAEGVETEAQYRFLETTGCHHCQGYGLARPAAAAATTERLQRQTTGQQATLAF